MVARLLGLQPLHGCSFLGAIGLSPHSRLRRQCGVIHNVTARAVNIAGYQHFAMKSLAELADAAEVGD